jgi:alanyl-tRNA synthetase
MAKERLRSGVIMATTVTEGKVALVTGVTSDLTHHVHAGQLAKAVAALVDGSRGGGADLSQAGGKSPEKLPAALEQVPSLVGDQLQ